jgi:hypothetical protein
VSFCNCNGGGGGGDDDDDDDDEDRRWPTGVARVSLAVSGTDAQAVRGSLADVVRVSVTC